MAMRADARALHARLWERRERQAFRIGFDRRFEACAVTILLFYEIARGSRREPVGEIKDAGTLNPR